VDTVSRGEMVEKELDGLIRRRHDHRVAEEGERPLHDAWYEGERKWEALREQRNRDAWIAFYLSQATAAERNGQLIAAENRARAERLMQDEAMLGLNGHEPNGHKEGA
jgi:hypothetical protein